MTFLLLALALFDSQFIFPPQSLHSHSSSVVELPNGDLYAVWYIGSGERRSDDVKLQASRLKKGSKTWSAPYTVADTPGFPDCNPIVFLDSKQRLRLLWPVIVDNNWESAVLKMKVSDGGYAKDPVKWTDADNLFLQPKNLPQKLEPYVKALMPQVPEGRDKKELERMIPRINDKLYNRLGWMPRVPPLQLASGRLLVPLYTDTYSVGLVAISDDGGDTWQASEPIVSLGGVQPSFVQKKDGTILAYMRDNGPPPQRVIVSESKDNGMTWTEGHDIDIPNPGSSVDVLALREGGWVFVGNDTEKGRQRLSIWLSEDEGKTWAHKKVLKEGPGGYSYPCVIQTKDGRIVVSYSHSERGGAENKEQQTIAVTIVDSAWIKAPAK